MDIAAEPQPSFVWGTNGTSIQIAGGWLAAKTPPAAIRIPRQAIIGADFTGSSHGHDDQNEYRNRQNDQNKVAVGKVARSEVLLRLIRFGGHSRQILVTQ